MKKYKIGYTQGTFDMFHIGHLNLINNAKKMCDFLIVGVNSDRLVQEYKNKTTVINENERRTIVDNIKAVDACYIVDSLDKEDALEKYSFDVIFIGDDWKGNPRWEKTKVVLEARGVSLIFLPHTEGVSSTILRPELANKVDED